MAPERISIGNCPKCNGTSFRCSYNHFAREELTIESWEHKCTDCGFRETKAYRSDERLEAGVDTMVCPFCGRRSSQNGY
jgi:hypothetical protein